MGGWSQGVRVEGVRNRGVGVEPEELGPEGLWSVGVGVGRGGIEVRENVVEGIGVGGVGVKGFRVRGVGVWSLGLESGVGVRRASKLKLP